MCYAKGILVYAQRYLNESKETSWAIFDALEAHFAKGNTGEIDLSEFMLRNKFAGAIVRALSELRVSGATFFEDISNVRSSINSIARNKLAGSLSQRRLDAFA